MLVRKREDKSKEQANKEHGVCIFTIGADAPREHKKI
jgi:hypothetical protein